MMVRHDKNEGFVLVVVLWVLAALTVITIGVGKRVVLDARVAAYALDQSVALMEARGAVNRGIIEVRNKAYKDYLQEDDRNVTHLGQSWAQPFSLHEGGYFEKAPLAEEDRCFYRIEDADRYIDINSAMIENGEKLLDNLHSVHGVLKREVRRRIYRRLREGDHEDEGRAVFHAPEEVRQIRGMDEEDWFGEKGKPGLKDLLTTHGGMPININTASEAVLRCIPDLRSGEIDAIIQYRAGADGELGTNDDLFFLDYVDIEEKLQMRGDGMQAIRRYCKVTSNFFIVTGVSTRRQGRVRAQATAVVRVDGFNAQVVEWQEATLGS